MIFFRLIIYKIKRVYHFLKTGIFRGLLSQIKYKYPARKLKIIAITGTDGKTTSSTLMYHVLKAAGKKVALVTTVAAYIGDEEIDTGFHVTTPDAHLVQRFLKRMVREGVEYVVLESTSHGLYQYRLWGIQPLVAGYTNITHEHLDYHVTYEEYVAAKAMLAKNAKHIVVNADDTFAFRELKKNLPSRLKDIETYSHEDPLPSSVNKAIKQRFDQPYNQMNARLVYHIAKILEIDNKDYITGLQEFPGVAGRMQVIGQEKGIQVIIDFAHTPNSLSAALEALRKKLKEYNQGTERKGRVISIFGCASQRDMQKRPIMGKISAELADVSIFTAEDPRNEDVWSIIRQMKQDLDSNYDKVLSIADRKEAIMFAVNQVAEPGDIIGIFGKGHEKSMNYRGVEVPWSDAAVAKEALEKLRKKSERHA